MHHPVRRRKRRSHNGSFSAVGARCVDILRGPRGFGFTISGQQPCLLSCIVAGSPAETAGLKPGLALVSVNGRNVARLPHDTVVRLIGGCMSLRLRVSENHYPHSSDSDLEDVDCYLPSIRREGRAARVLRDLHSGVLFSEVTASPPLQLPPRGVQNPPPPPPPSRIHPIDFRAVVGYLGTIELPRVLLPGSRLAVIRSCVRRMRAEKRVHTVVTLSVRRESSVILSDTAGAILAEFPAERVAFCGACADDKRFFGLVTNVASLEEEDEAGVCGGGSSCHVFMVEPALHSHKTHVDRATAFRITCTPCGAGCAEFPAQAEPILRAVAALHSPRSPPPPPPRSNTSNSSNSDSGIGFPSEQERLTVRAMPDPPILLNKLSPKVFPSSSLAAHSLEDIPPLLQPSGDESMSSLEQQQHWGSLQDLRASPGRLVRRRTHHQHPCCLAPPQMMAPPVPQTLELQQLDDEDDYAVPFKRWCSGSYVLNAFPPLGMQPPVTPTLPPRVLQFSSDSLEDPSPPYDPSKPTAGQHFIQQLSLFSPLTPRVTLESPRNTSEDCRGDDVSTKTEELDICSSSNVVVTPCELPTDQQTTHNTTTTTTWDYADTTVAQLSENCEVVLSEIVQNTSVNNQDTTSVPTTMLPEIIEEKYFNCEEITSVLLTKERSAHLSLSESPVTSKENKLCNAISRLDTITECEESSNASFNNGFKFVVDSTNTINSSIAKIKSCCKLSITPNNEFTNTQVKKSLKRKCDDSNLREVCNTIRNFNDSYSIIAHETSKLETNFNLQFRNPKELFEPFNNLIKTEMLQECFREPSICDRLINVAKIVSLTTSDTTDILSPVTRMTSENTPVTHNNASGLTPLLKNKLKIESHLLMRIKSSCSPEASVMETKLIASETEQCQDCTSLNMSMKPLSPTPILNIPCHVKANIKDGDARATSRSHSEGGSEHGTSSRGPHSCFDSFERLLDDPSGMHAFAEFLKKEFSHENIYFWVACEKYRRLDGAARKTQAKAIFQRHLAAGAPEPVNVDSQARQSAREGLEQAKVDLFVSAQKQIFNLMKFDSYPRYLKCSESILEPASPLIELDPDLLLHVGDEPNPGKLKKSRSDAEDRRRKSLLPWHRGGGGKSAGQSRSKSRERADTPGVPEDSSSLRSELTGSRSSLASSDLALIQRGSSSRQSLSSGGEGAAELCRVLLPDGATTVIPTQRGETTKQLILRLLDKRGLHFSSFELFMENDTKAVVLSEDSTILSGKEVRVERRVVFRLDLPSRKTVGVKAKAGRTLSEVLKPILHKYGYKLENTTVTLICDTEPLDPNLLITAVENQRLQATVTGPDGWREKGSVPAAKNGATLDEITNRVFEELLQGKNAESTDGAPQLESTAHSDQGSVRSEDWSSEHSSGIFGRFLRRDSAFIDKTRESRSKSKKSVPNKHTSLELDTTKLAAMSNAGASVSNVSAKTKWKLRPQVQGKSESDELYEGLKRAQRSRLEDQRGTEINFQLPDFLKDKENTPEQARRLKKGRLGEGECVPLLTTDGIDLSVSEGIIPSPGQAENYFSSADQSETYFCEPAPPPPLRHTNQPPPLPPKPKPATRPNWQSASEDEAKSFSQSATSYV